MARFLFKHLSSKKTAVGFVVGLMFAAPAFSQVYKYKDKDGNIVISTTPPPPGVKSENKKIEGDRPASKADASAARSSTQTPDMKRPYKDIKVILYVKSWSNVSREASTFLKSLGVNLTEYDVDKDAEARKEWVRKLDGRLGVPLIDIEGKILMGLYPGEIRAAVEEKRSAMRPY